MFGIMIDIVGILVSGFVLSKLWLWFVASVFGLPELTIAQSIGLGLIGLLFVGGLYVDEDESMDKFVKFARDIILPISILVLGWIIHLFV